jgi:ABC-2 type transport system permease protein
MNRYSHRQAVRTVTAREIQVAVHSKGLVITAALTLVAVVAGILGVHFFGSDDDDAPDLVVTGMDTTAVSRVLGDSVEVTSAPDRDAAVAAVAAVKDDGRDGALIRGDDGFELVTDGAADPVVASAAQIAASAVAQNEALTAVGVAPDAFAAALPDATVHATDVSDAAQEDRLPAIVTTMVGTMVILMFILTFSANVGGRVTEEKSSRVVEIILATIRPLDLLAGKVLAMLIVGLACTAVILSVALVTMSAIGVLSDVDLSPATLLVLLVAYILGMLFFSALYAAAGSLVSKAEELSSTQMPVMLVFFAVMYPPLLGFSSLDSTFLQVLSWVPPMSLGLAPLQFAAGNFSLWQLGASFVVLAVATLLVLLLVARIYRSAILNNGRRLSWFRALRTA